MLRSPTARAAPRGSWHSYRGRTPQASRELPGACRPFVHRRRDIREGLRRRLCNSKSQSSSRNSFLVACATEHRQFRGFVNIRLTLHRRGAPYYMESVGTLTASANKECVMAVNCEKIV